MPDIKLEEILISNIATALASSRHVAVGAASPIPAAAALLAQHSNPTLTVSLLGNQAHSAFTDGGRELFDCAAQGRIDTFFLSGVQIDGAANINLVGTGSYPDLKRRFAGSFGSAYLYDIVPNVILFCWTHKPGVLVDKVDFISAAGPRNDGRFRPGGPTMLITDKCLFRYDRERTGFVLTHLHPQQTETSVQEHTGFAYTEADVVKPSLLPDATTLDYIRTTLSDQMTHIYPLFAQRVWQGA